MDMQAFWDFQARFAATQPEVADASVIARAVGRSDAVTAAWRARDGAALIAAIEEAIKLDAERRIADCFGAQMENAERYADDPVILGRDYALRYNAELAAIGEARDTISALTREEIESGEYEGPMFFSWTTR